MHHPPQTSPSLILRLRNRDDLDAWQQFAEIYQPLVFRLAVQRGFQHSDASDIAQEVLLRVAGAIDRFVPAPERGSFRAWLNRIARNFMITFLQKQQRQPVACGQDSVADLMAVVPDSHDLTSEEFDHELARQVFAWAAKKVEAGCQPSTWQAFWRTTVNDEDAAIVAEQLNVSVGAVYVARSRIIQRLKREVQTVIRSNNIEEMFQ